MHDVKYYMTCDIIGQCSIRSAAALRCPCCGSGLAATLPRLCRPDPALAETLSPDPLRLRDGYHPSVAPAVAPHPDVHLVEPAAVALVPVASRGQIASGHGGALEPDRTTGAHLRQLVGS